MPHRFFYPALVEAGSVILEDTEAHHLIHVLRHQPNDVVELFNGEGLVASCRVVSIRKRDVALEILTSIRVPQQPAQLTLATAVPKGDRFDWLIEKATELGVHQLVPLTTVRSVVDPRSSKLDKLRQTVITACKQSGRNHLMSISAVTTWSEFLNQFAGNHRVMVAHPQGEPIVAALEHAATGPRQIAIAIGPEGGFSDEEIGSAVGAGARSVHLGQHILRIETAAIALAARILL